MQQSAGGWGALCEGEVPRREVVFFCCATAATHTLSRCFWRSYQGNRSAVVTGLSSRLSMMARRGRIYNRQRRAAARAPHAPTRCAHAPLRRRRCTLCCGALSHLSTNPLSATTLHSPGLQRLGRLYQPQPSGPRPGVRARTRSGGATQRGRTQQQQGSPPQRNAHRYDTPRLAPTHPPPHNRTSLSR